MARTRIASPDLPARIDALAEEAGGVGAFIVAVRPLLAVAEGDVAAALFAEATRRFAALDAACAVAFQRFPAVGRSAFHGGHPDARAFQAYATISHLRTAGAYTPAELEAAASGADTWLAREALRLIAILTAVRMLLQDLEAGALPPAQYQERVRDVVAAFA